MQGYQRTKNSPASGFAVRRTHLDPIGFHFKSNYSAALLQIAALQQQNLLFFSRAIVKTELERDHSQLLSSFCSPFGGAAGIDGDWMLEALPVCFPTLITKQSKEGFFCSLFADSYST